MADDRHCRECGKALMWPPRKGRTPSGFCRSCKARQKWTDEHRANASASRKKLWVRKLADPAGRAEAIESGRRLRERYPSTPEIREKQQSGRDRSIWIPEGYAALNRTLMRKGCRLAERKQIIATEVLRDAERQRAERRAADEALTPFERQLERVRNGAKLIDKPSFSKADPAYTLGGVATGML